MKNTWMAHSRKGYCAHYSRSTCSRYGVEVRAEQVHIECLLMGKLLAEIEIYCWLHVIYNILCVSESILPSLVSLRCNLAISPVELM